MRKGVRRHGRLSARVSVMESLTLTEMFERFMQFKRNEGLARRTIEEYEEHFTWLLDFFDRDLTRKEINTELFLDYVHYMTHEKKLMPNTVNIRIRTMRAFIRYCHKENLIDEAIHERFKPIKVPEGDIESLSLMEVKLLLNAFDESTFVGFRDKVMVMVLLDTMVRISELTTMKRVNVDLRSGLIKLEATDTKTRKAREVPLSSKTIRLLKDYMIESDEFGNELLFLTYDGREILSNTWRTRLHEVAELAGIQKKVKPHVLRHTGALFYVKNGGDPFSLQKILGHSDISMTKRYVNMTNTDLKRQHNQFSPLRNI